MRIILLLIIFSFTAVTVFGQEHCKTDIIHQRLLQKNAAYRQKFEQAEKNTEAILKANANSRLQGTVYKVPVVVHVIHRGSAVGVNENISDEQIYSAIKSLNNAYRKIPGTAGFGNGADAEVEFCLAQKDPNGVAHSGINRINGNSVTDFPAQGITDNNELNVKNLIRWNTAKYYNIWVVPEIDDNNAGPGVQGYAYLPPADPNYDGAVMLYNAFGFDEDGSRGYNLKSYTNKNITAIHELGHAFGLYHTFQGDGTGSTCPTDADCGTNGDCVNDTPIHMRSTSNCLTGTNTCTGGSRDLFIHNYLDYSSDICQNEFTAGQVARMKARIAATRATLVSASNLTACGCDGSKAPIARFYYSSGALCEGSPINFFDESIDFPTTWSWTFEGGTPSTSNSQNPTVTFSGAGPYDVTLVVGSSQAVNGTVTKPNIISPLVGKNLPFTEDFEAATFPPTGWTLYNPDNGSAAFGVSGKKTWVRNAVAGNGASTNGAAINLFEYNTGPLGQRDGLITPPINLSGVTSPSLSFKVAHKNYPISSNYDTLRVYVSDDCGNTYTKVYEKYGATLATNGSSSNTFVPAVANDWRTESIDLTNYIGDNVLIQFASFNAYGNNIFLDDISVQTTGYTLPIADFAATKTTAAVSEAIRFTESSSGQITTYTWDFGSGASLSAGTTGAGPHQVSYATTGSKTVSLTVSGPGGSDSETKTSYINVGPLGIINAAEQEGIIIFPNPASTEVEIKSEYAQIKNIQLYDGLGRLCKEVNPDANNSKINVEELPKGIYTIKIVTNDKVVTRKFVVS